MLCNIMASILIMQPIYTPSISPCSPYFVAQIDSIEDLKYDDVNQTKLSDNLDRLDRFANFQYNWNGYGAEPIPNQLIVRTKNLLQNLKEQPDVFPTANKSIQIEYEKTNGEYLEFEIFGDNHVHMFRVYADGTECDETFNFDLSQINKNVGEFYGRID